MSNRTGIIINNAASKRDVDFWTKHLQNDEKNERAELKHIRGLAADNLRDALLEMQQQGQLLPRLENFMYHADFNPLTNEAVTEQQWERMFEIFERERGIPANQPRVVFEHEKNGRIHRHVIWSRVDMENMRAFADGLDAKIAHTAARKIADELGLQRTISPFDKDREGPRPPRAPEPWEMYRGMQSGIDPRDVTAEVTALREQSDTGRAFQAALEQHGYQLVTGDRGLLILDSAGKEHSLARRCGMKAKELNEFMRDVDRAALPTIEQGKELYQQRKIAGLEADRETVRHEIEWEEKLAQAAIDKEKIEGRFIAPEDREREARAGQPWKEPAGEWPMQPPQPEPIKTSPLYHVEDAAREIAQPRPNERPTATPRFGDIRMQKAEHAAMLDERTKEGAGQPNAKAFAKELERYGLAFARVSADEAHRSHREAEFAKAIGNYAPRFKEWEIVAVSEPGLEYHRDGQWKEPPRVHKLDQTKAEKYLAMLSLDKKQLQGIDATKSMLDARAERRAEEREAIRLEKATTIYAEAPELGPRKPKAPRIMAGVSSLAFGAAGKSLDIVSDIFDSIFAPKLTPEQIREGEIAMHKRSADAENSAEFASHMAQLAQERQNREADQAARDRQRENERER